jgi:two-component system chemotaxis response regulator CheY
MAARVLVVDDSLAVGHQLKRMFEQDGRFELVGHARNGAEGLKLFAQEKPDLVILDIIMPVMDGLQALRAIMGMNPQARVVMISSVAGAEERGTEALRLGAKALLSKPVDPVAALDQLERVLKESAS